MVYVVCAARYSSAEHINGGHGVAASVEGEPNKFLLNLVKLRKQEIKQVDEGKEITANQYDDAWKIIIQIEQS